MTVLENTYTADNIFKTDKKRVLSGIQPTGILHIGNYIGAISVWVQKQHEFNNLFMIANLHALTIPEAVKADVLRHNSRMVAALYVACGIDPDSAVIFLQSDVPGHAYLSWILGCCTPMGWLERMTQFKTKSEQAESVSSGLFTYPALQAADILIYKANFVPVGEDQSQHVEITRDIAQRFNHLFGECFPLPQGLYREAGARVMGLDDPTAKMSKSVAETRKGHAISLLDEPSVIKKAIMSAVTDPGSEVRFEHASPGVKNLLVLYEVLSGESRPAIEEKFAGKGYGFLKRELLDQVVRTLEPIQKRYREITEDERYLDDLLANGAAKARAIADQTVAEVRRLTGV
ncbi:MAG: tryptophan--tRNA ligase [Anaerolineae bacterium]|nr:tryptophan--tRNA ligase [Anaerolineae bacterium]